MGVTIQDATGKVLEVQHYDAVDFYEHANAPARHLISAAAQILRVSPTELTVERGDGVTTVQRTWPPQVCAGWDVPIGVSRPGLWRRLLRWLRRVWRR